MVAGLLCPNKLPINGSEAPLLTSCEANGAASRGRAGP